MIMRFSPVGCPVRWESSRSTRYAERLSTSRLARLPSSVGMVPVNSFSQRYNSRRLVRLPSQAGTVPVNWFCERPSNSRLARLRIPKVTRRSTGSLEGQHFQIGKVAQFGGNRSGQLVAPRDSTSRLARLPSSVGIVPVNWFCEGPALPGLARLASSGRYRPGQLVLREVKLFQIGKAAQFGGIVPVNWFPEGQLFPDWQGCPARPVSSRSTGSATGPAVPNWQIASCGGIVPVNWFSRDSNSRLARLPSSAGIVPVNWFPQRTAHAGWRGCPVRPVLSRSTGCCERVSTSRLARLPSRPVSSRSTGSPEGPAVSGWRGCPVRPVSFRSTGCRRGPAVQIGEAAQFGRYRPGQLVVPRYSHSIGRDCPVGWVSSRSTGYPIGTAISGWRDCPVPPVSSLSTGSPIGTAIRGWRDCPVRPVSCRQLVAARTHSRLARLPIRPVSSRSLVGWPRDSVRRLVRLPSPDGIWPVNAFSGSINPVTRSGVSPSATPSHWSTGMFADQFSVALPAKAVPGGQ